LSWFDNYHPVEHLSVLVSCEIEAPFNEEPFDCLHDMVEKALFQLAGAPAEPSGYRMDRLSREEIEEAVDHCNQLIWDYVESSNDFDETELHIARDGMFDAWLIGAALEDAIAYDDNDSAGEETPEKVEVVLTTGRVLDERSLHSALALWKIDHTIGAIRAGDLAASVRLSLDAANALRQSQRLFDHAMADMTEATSMSRRAQHAAMARQQPATETRRLLLERFFDGAWVSKRAAATALFPQLRIDAEERFGFRFAARGQQTVYEWICRAEKKRRHPDNV
jgi:hypothetical protein